MKYATIDQIRNWLRGRLEVPGTPLFAGAAAGKVDDSLINQIGEIVEAKIDMALAQIYKLPIPDSATQAKMIVGGIVQKLIVSEIALVHFQQTINPEQGGDAGFGAVIRKQAVQDLEALLLGHGVYIPGITQPKQANLQMGMHLQPLVLPGVPLLSEAEQPDTISRNYTFLGKREISKEQDIFSFD